MSRRRHARYPPAYVFLGGFGEGLIVLYAHASEAVAVPPSSASTKSPRGRSPRGGPGDDGADVVGFGSVAAGGRRRRNRPRCRRHHRRRRRRRRLAPYSLGGGQFVPRRYRLQRPRVRRREGRSPVTVSRLSPPLLLGEQQLLIRKGRQRAHEVIPVMMALLPPPIPPVAVLDVRRRGLDGLGNALGVVVVVLLPLFVDVVVVVLLIAVVVVRVWQRRAHHPHRVVLEAVTAIIDQPAIVHDGGDGRVGGQRMTLDDHRRRFGEGRSMALPVRDRENHQTTLLPLLSSLLMLRILLLLHLLPPLFVPHLPGRGGRGWGRGTTTAASRRGGHPVRRRRQQRGVVALIVDEAAADVVVVVVVLGGSPHQVGEGVLRVIER